MPRPPQAHGDTSFFLYSVGFYYEDFVWAVCSVMSRQNEIPLKDGKSSALALIPLWDMCNHWMGEWVDGAGGGEKRRMVDALLYLVALYMCILPLSVFYLPSPPFLPPFFLLSLFPSFLLPSPPFLQKYTHTQHQAQSRQTSTQSCAVVTASPPAQSSPERSCGYTTELAATRNCSSTRASSTLPTPETP